jgi:hypothetical protein
MPSLTLKMTKGENGLKPISPLMSNLYKDFVNNVQPGQQVEVVFTIITKDGTLPQLKKLHAMIREVANETGQDFEEVKLYIKQKAGFINISSDDVDIKSFADMTRDELSACIQATINLGDNLGLSL